MKAARRRSQSFDLLAGQIAWQETKSFAAQLSEYTLVRQSPT